MHFDSMLKQLDDLTPDIWTGRYDQAQYKVLFTTTVQSAVFDNAFYCMFKTGSDVVWFLYEGSLDRAAMHINDFESVKNMDWNISFVVPVVAEELYKGYERAKHGA